MSGSTDTFEILGGIEIHTEGSYVGYLVIFRYQQERCAAFAERVGDTSSWQICDTPEPFASNGAMLEQFRTKLKSEHDATFLPSTIMRFGQGAAANETEKPQHPPLH